MMMPAWAHPRVGGENSPLHLTPSEVQGSSPRGRGKPVLLAAWCQTRRLIPAWAGKTHSFIRKADASAAHPRVGGENVNKLTVAGGAKGSSPRGRGKRLEPARRRRVPRLIPAWAGKTEMIEAFTACPPAHPRVGGENIRVARR